MKNKGFTLIELLAIIVILAIIAVITIPKITKITEKSRKDSASLSANGYIEAVEKYAMINSQNDDEFEMEGEFEVIDGNLSKESDTYKINVNGTIPSNGNLVISEGDVISGCLTVGKYKVIIQDEKVSNTTKGNCYETYTITFDSNGGSDVESISAINGRPITRPSNPTKANTNFLGWYTEEELTNKFNFENGVTEDTTLYAKWGEPSFATDSWADIKENLTYDRNFYPIGSEKIVAMNLTGTTQNYTLRLANTSTPSACSANGFSQTACGVVIEFKTLVGNYYYNTSNTNTGGWKESNLHTYLNDTIYNNLPEDLKAVIIKTAPIVSEAGSGGVSDDITAPGDYLYLQSAPEVGIVSANDSNTRKLTFYETNNSKKANTSGSYAIWWLRSAYPDGNSFYVVTDSGTSSYSNAGLNNWAFSPTFRILD